MKYLMLISLYLSGMYAGEASATQERTMMKLAQIVYGKITKIENAMGYNYLKVDINGTEQWVAIAKAPVKVGDTIGYDNRTVMKNFKSKTLGRTFPQIVFANEVYLTQKPTQPNTLKSMLDAPADSKKPLESKVKVEKVPQKDFYTVEEVHRYRKGLAGKTVSVKAKVYKVSRNIIGRDWVHLGDGTGNEKALTDDLVFTAKKASVKAGDSVVAQAKIVVDKDFGYGYFYPVIGEEAECIKAKE